MEFSYRKIVKPLIFILFISKVLVNNQIASIKDAIHCVVAINYVKVFSYSIYLYQTWRPFYHRTSNNHNSGFTSCFSKQFSFTRTLKSCDSKNVILIGFGIETIRFIKFSKILILYGNASS
jgi:hypothetical protein